MCHSNLGLAITYVGSLGITGGGTGKNLIEVIGLSGMLGALLNYYSALP